MKKHRAAAMRGNRNVSVEPDRSIHFLNYKDYANKKVAVTTVININAAIKYIIFSKSIKRLPFHQIIYLGIVLCVC